MSSFGLNIQDMKEDAQSNDSALLSLVSQQLQQRHSQQQYEEYPAIVTKQKRNKFIINQMNNRQIIGKADNNRQHIETGMLRNRYRKNITITSEEIREKTIENTTDRELSVEEALSFYPQFTGTADELVDSVLYKDESDRYSQLKEVDTLELLNNIYNDDDGSYEVTKRVIEHYDVTLPDKTENDIYEYSNDELKTLTKDIRFTSQDSITNTITDITNNDTYQYYKDRDISELVADLATYVIGSNSSKKMENGALWRTLLINYLAASIFINPPSNIVLTEKLSERIQSEIRDNVLPRLDLKGKQPSSEEYVLAKNIMFQHKGETWRFAELVNEFAYSIMSFISYLQKTYLPNLTTKEMTQVGVDITDDGQHILNENIFSYACQYVYESNSLYPFIQASQEGFILSEYIKSANGIDWQKKTSTINDFMQRTDLTGKPIIICETGTKDTYMKELISSLDCIGRLDKFGDSIIVAETCRSDSCSKILSEFIESHAIEHILTVSKIDDNPIPVNPDGSFGRIFKYNNMKQKSQYNKNDLRYGIENTNNSELYWTYEGNIRRFEKISGGYFLSVMLHDIVTIACARKRRDTKEIILLDKEDEQRYINKYWLKLLKDFTFCEQSIDICSVIGKYHLSYKNAEMFFSLYDNLSSSGDINLGNEGVAFYNTDALINSHYGQTINNAIETFEIENISKYHTSDEEITKLCATFRNTLISKGHHASIANEFKNALNAKKANDADKIKQSIDEQIEQMFDNV